MNLFFKSIAIVAVSAATLMACDDQNLSPSEDAAGKAAAIIGLGLPGGTDNVDVYGNVTVDSRFRSGVLIRSGSELKLFNSIITGYKNFQLEVAPASTFPSPVIVQGTTLVAPAYNSLAGVLTNVSGYVANGNRAVTATESGTSDPFTLPVLTGLNANAWNASARNFIATVEQASVSNALLSGLTTVDFRGAFGNFSEANNANWFISAPWVAFN